MFSLIVAIGNNNVIGKDNKLIWHISEDLKRFKEITLNKTILMGRKTFESLPGVLPKRNHIVLTKNKSYSIDSDSVKIEHDINSILEKYKDSEDEIFIIGGAEIYKEFLPYCKNLYITKVHSDFDGDAFFPEFDTKNYEIEYSSPMLEDSKSNLKYSFIDYKRIRK